ncbi:hypothetical protein AKJ09_02412 [Labilithrix luteola]|uniref:Ricin B lectin domain-containing protein n=1 Tax=Labilithrix luteola TaxID=1391654 RepID=A0A0K1PQF0_9BACT|nr:hypothetical protein AKJ09_02412 [Labilithrix luteola]
MIQGATLQRGTPNPSAGETGAPVINYAPTPVTVTGQATLADHVDTATTGYVLEINPSQHSGMALVNGAVTAPMYYAIQEFIDCVEITYVMLFAYQGGQTIKGLRAGTEFYAILNDYGQHEGDYEEFVVRLVRHGDDWQLSAVAYEAHGDFTWYKPGEFDTEGGDHPIVHSALNGHSLHNTKDQGFWHTEDHYPGAFDIGSSMSTGIPWRAYEVTNGLRRIGLDADGNVIGDQQWAKFSGRLGRFQDIGYTGATQLDGSKLNAFDGKWIDTDREVADMFNKIPPQFKHGIGPNGPAARPYIRPGHGYRRIAPLMVLHQSGGDTGSLWFETRDCTTWNGAERLSFVTLSESPSPVVFQNQFLVFHQGGGHNKELWRQTFDGVSTWTSSKVANVLLTGSPAAIVYLDKLHVFHTGGGGSDLWQLTTSDLSNWADVPLHAGITGSPSAAIFGNQLYLFHRAGGNGDGLWRMVYEGERWVAGDWQIPNVAMSGSPAAVSFENKLYVFHQGGGNNGELWYQCFDGSNWVSHKIPNVTVSDSPAAVVHYGLLWVFIRGGEHNDELWYMTSSDGVTWSAAQKREDIALSGSPAAIVWNTARPLPDGVYTIRNQGSGKVIDVTGASMDDGTAIIQWPGRDAANQRWTFTWQDSGFYKITAFHSGKALDVSGASTDNGGAVIQWPFHNGDNQLWQVSLYWDGSCRLINRHSRKDLTVGGAITQDGAPLVQNAWDNNDRQKWIIVPVTTRVLPDGVYTIKNQSSGKAVDVSGASSADGTAIILWPGRDGAANQRWTFTWQGNGVYKITAVHSGKALDVSGAAMNDGGAVIQWPFHNGDNQLWEVALNWDGCYRLTNRHSGKVLTVDGSQDGAPLVQSAWTETAGQKWVINLVNA